MRILVFLGLCFLLFSGSAPAQKKATKSGLKTAMASAKNSRRTSVKQASYRPIFRTDGKKFEDTTLRNPKTCTIVLDAGHGGRDPGREASRKDFLPEKDLALEITLAVGEKIEENLKNIKVVFTREDDVTVSLEERVELANRIKADYFISIHLNSNPNRHISGTRTHIHDHSFKVSRALALAIEAQYEKAGLKSRGIQSAKDRGENLYVLQYTEMPGVLTEAGFLTNPEEEKMLNSIEGQEKIAEAIYQAIKEVIAAKLQVEEHKTYYCVQLEAFEFPQDVNAERYKALGMQVREIISSTSPPYRYKYVVGREYDESLARQLAAKVRAAGFKGAFVIKVEP